MRLKDGRQVCPKCQGHGCYWCRRVGFRDQCPQCMNQEPELITKGDLNFTCHVCDIQFTSAGRIADQGS